MKGKNEVVDIVLEPKSDPKKVLALSYYSNVFFQNMVMDSVVAILLQRHFSAAQDTLKYDELFI